MRTLVWCHRSEALDRLLVLIGDPSPTIRAQTAHELRLFDDPQAIEALMEAVPDTHRNVCIQVVLSLGDLRPKHQAFAGQITSILLLSLQDPREKVRLAALNAIGSMYDEQLCAALKDLLQDPRRTLPFIKVATALGLQSRELAFQESRAILQDPAQNLDWRFGAVRYVGSLRDRVIEQPAEVFSPLFEGLADPEPQVRAAAVEEIGTTSGFGPEKQALIVDQLLAMIADPSPEVGFSVAAAFCHIRDERAVATLLTRLSAALDEEPEKLALQIINALGVQNDPRAVDPLLELLMSRSPRLLDRTIIALSKIHDTCVVEPLFQLLESQMQHLSPFTVVEALGSLQNPRGIELLKSPQIRSQRYLTTMVKFALDRMHQSSENA